MNLTPTTPGRDEAVEATAAAWLAQRDDGLTAAEAAEFARWCAADAGHAAAVARLERAWGALGQLADFRPEARAHPDRDLLARPVAARRNNLIPFPALAAAGALAAGLALAAVAWRWAHPAPAATEVQTLATTAGGYERATLPDGSVVELNTNSEVRVAFAPAERHVTLVRGEAHFTVAKNKARPFVVVAGGVAVRAVGTAFDVRLGAHAVEVLVTEGRVQVKSTEAAANAAPALPELGAGERLVIPSAPPEAEVAVAAPAVEKLAPAAIRETLAWQEPRLVFVETPLAEVVAKFNRANRVQLTLADAELGALPVGGSFQVENVEAFVRLLESSRDVAVERRGEREIVLRRVR